MNFPILAAVFAIWLTAVSYVTSVTTLISDRPIELAIVAAMLVTVGLVIHFANKREDVPDLADETGVIPDAAPLAEETMAGVVAENGVIFPLHDAPLPAGIRG